MAVDDQLDQFVSPAAFQQWERLHKEAAQFVDEMEEVGAAARNAFSDFGAIKNLTQLIDVTSRASISNKNMANSVTSLKKTFDDIDISMLEFTDGTDAAREALDANAKGYVAAKQQVEKYKEAIKTADAALKAKKITEDQHFEAVTNATDAMASARAEMKLYADAQTAAAKARALESAEFQNVSLEMQQNRQELIASNLEQKRLAQGIGTTADSIKEAEVKTALWREELKALNLETDEGIARQKELIALIDERTAFIKTNVDASAAQGLNIGNYSSAAGDIDFLTARLEQLKQEGKETTQEFFDLEAQIKRVEAATSGLGASAGGSGAAFTSTSQQLSALKVNMQGLVSAGKEDTAEFREMQAEALRLSAAMEKVSVAVKEVSSVGDRFTAIAEKMGLRMLANLVIFQALSTIAQDLWTEWTKDAKSAEELTKSFKQLDDSAASSAAKEYSQAQVLLSIARDLKEPYDIRLKAVKDLQDKYPDYLGNLSKEAILTGNVAEAMERLNAALLNKALTEAAEGKVSELAKKYIDLQDEIQKTTLRIQGLQRIEDNTVAVPSGTGRFAPTKNSFTANQLSAAEAELNRLKKQGDDLKAQMLKYQQEANDFASKAAPLIVDDGKNTKTKDTTNKDTSAMYQAQKALNDAIAELAKQRYKQDADDQKEIFDNEKEYLGKRLDAYKQYQADMTSTRHFSLKTKHTTLKYRPLKKICKIR